MWEEIVAKWALSANFSILDIVSMLAARCLKIRQDSAEMNQIIRPASERVRVDS